jgi:16S rRNA (guanine527-N7)-methyltransferase
VLPLDAMAARLRAGAADLKLTLSEAQLDALLNYAQLLLKWNAVYNLTAVRDPMDVVELHLLDCLTLMRALASYDDASSVQLVDVGSGAGLPAAIIAILKPTWQVVAIDAVEKKIAFQRQAAAQLRLPNWHPHHGRVQDWAWPAAVAASAPAHVTRLITARAYASLRLLVDSTQHLADPSSRWLAMKGKIPFAELDELAEHCPQVQLLSTQAIPIPGHASERHLLTLALTSHA